MMGPKVSIGPKVGIIYKLGGLGHWDSMMRGRTTCSTASGAGTAGGSTRSRPTILGAGWTIELPRVLA